MNDEHAVSGRVVYRATDPEATYDEIEAKGMLTKPRDGWIKTSKPIASAVNPVSSPYRDPGEVPKYEPDPTDRAIERDNLQRQLDDIYNTILRSQNLPYYTLHGSPWF